MLLNTWINIKRALSKWWAFLIAPAADMASFNAMKSFAGAISDSGSLIFTACNAGAFEGILGVRLNDLFKKAGLSVNFNMYFNADQSRQYKALPNNKEQVLDYSLTPKASFRNGWYKISPNGEVTHIKKSLQLNNRGTCHLC